MKLLVTGGLGFIGSNFILYILEKHPDFEITNIDAELTGSNKKNLAGIKKGANYQFLKGNISDKQIMNKLVKTGQEPLKVHAPRKGSNGIKTRSP